MWVLAIIVTFSTYVGALLEEILLGVKLLIINLVAIFRAIQRHYFVFDVVRSRHELLQTRQVAQGVQLKLAGDTIHFLVTLDEEVIAFLNVDAHVDLGVAGRPLIRKVKGLLNKVDLAALILFYNLVLDEIRIVHLVKLLLVS